jgi:hypothetical protein
LAAVVQVFYLIFNEGAQDDHLDTARPSGDGGWWRQRRKPAYGSTQRSRPWSVSGRLNRVRLF